MPIGETYTVKIPECKYYTLASSDVADGETLTLDADRTLHLVYATDALTGVKADGEVVTKLEAGKSYLFYDATTAPGRAGYRAILSGNASTATPPPKACPQRPSGRSKALAADSR